jgi:hypothetical protein
MKKIVFFILLSAIGFGLKAQQNRFTPNHTPLSMPGLRSFSDTVPTSKLSKQQQNDLNLLFYLGLNQKARF